MNQYSYWPSKKKGVWRLRSSAKRQRSLFPTLEWFWDFIYFQQAPQSIEEIILILFPQYPFNPCESIFPEKRSSCFVELNQLYWVGHIARMPDTKLLKQTLYSLLGKAHQMGRQKGLRMCSKLPWKCAKSSMNTWESHACSCGKSIQECTEHFECTHQQYKKLSVNRVWSTPILK